MTPDELAVQVGRSGRTVRAWLRRTYPRSATEHNQRWVLTPEQVTAARAHFGAPQAAQLRPRTPTIVTANADAATATDAEKALLGSTPRTRDEVLARPSAAPAQPGVYAWWFRQLPPSVPDDGLTERDGLRLLYVGISPGRPASSERSSRPDLRKRLRTHYRGNASTSTLRRSLGVLLSEELGTQLRRTGPTERLTFGESEAELSAWMGQNALVSWAVHPRPWEEERDLIHRFDLPLNLQHNSAHPFHAALSAARAAAIAAA